jgi:gluconolactonase
MDRQQRFSRRHVLASMAAGGVALGLDHRRALAQTGRRIERFDPALDDIISPTEPIVDLATDLGGTANVEGLLWWREGGYLLFRGTDLSRWKYEPGQPLSVFKENSNAANGITRDLQGRLVACEAATRRVVREERDGSITVLADTFDGRSLNYPNDIVVKSDGSIYFTDPWAGPRASAPPTENDLGFSGVYRLSPDGDTLSLLVDDIRAPNGIAFSADESVLYIVDTGTRQIRAFDVESDGLIARESGRVFADVSGPEPGYPDGLKVDTAGNVYCGGAGGLFIMDSSGKKLGLIVHGFGATPNVAFGDDDWKTVYFCTRDSLGSFRVKIPGIPVPVAARA